MNKLFSVLYDILDQDGVGALNRSVKNKFAYNLQEALGRGKPPPTRSEIGGPRAVAPGGDLEDDLTDQKAQRAATLASEPVPATTSADAAAMGYNDVPVAGAEPAAALPTGTPPANDPAPTETAGIGSKMKEIGSKTLGGLKKAAAGFDKAANFMAYGQPGGDDPRELAAALRSVSDDEGSQAFLNSMIAKISGVESNPDAVRERLVAVLSRELGIQPSPTTAVEGIEAIEIDQFKEGRFGDIMRKGADAALGGVEKAAGGMARGAEGIGKVAKAAPAYMKKLERGIKNVHQGTGGKPGSGKSDMAGLASGQLQSAGLQKGTGEIWNKALRDPATLNDNPGWQHFLQTATPAEKQAFLDYINNNIAPGYMPPQQP